jgi:hypothetical protein
MLKFYSNKALKNKDHKWQPKEHISSKKNSTSTYEIIH